VERRSIAGHSPLEPVAGYSRAVVVDGRVHVSGTAPIPPDGSDPPEGSYEQARLCIEIIRGALERAGATLADIVRTRMFMTPEADFDEILRAHGEAFRDIRPATAGIVVHALLDPRWLVEIEADAVVGSGTRAVSSGPA
jgi:enamine deaminase RidA (YjgF/YER057c/UK114 family)